VLQNLLITGLNTAYLIFYYLYKSADIPFYPVSLVILHNKV